MEGTRWMIRWWTAEDDGAASPCVAAQAAPHPATSPWSVFPAPGNTATQRPRFSACLQTQPSQN
eukprot:912235-Rhodomonas_salina.4